MSAIKTATFVSESTNGSGAAWKIYKLDPPIAFSGIGTAQESLADFVVVSANNLPYTGPETYIFPSDGEDVIDWLELPGSYRGGLDHAEALENAGYEVRQ